MKTQVKFIQGWVSQQNSDAIVTLLPQSLDGSDDIYQEIADAAGKDFDAYVLENVLSPKPGDVFAVPGFSLPCKHVLIAITPVWRTEFDREDKTLSVLCRKVMEKAADMKLDSVAFPLMQGGKFGYPKKRAARLIAQGIAERLNDKIADVRIVCDDEADLNLFREYF